MKWLFRLGFRSILVLLIIIALFASPLGSVLKIPLAPNKIEAAGVTITEFSLPIASDEPYGITAGPDGNIWFAEETAGKIGKITPYGYITMYTITLAPQYLTSGPDGNLWITVANGNYLGKATTSGQFTRIPIPTGHIADNGITTGPDGNLWFAEGIFNGSNNIGRITTSGIITEFPLPNNSYPQGITAGPDGNIWFTEEGTNKIGKITTSGVITEFQIPTNGSSPYGITSGPDGNLWFTECNGNNIGRITPDGIITEIAIPTTNSCPYGIVAGSDGNLWFTEGAAKKIGRITTDGIITEISVPNTSSVPFLITSGPDGNIWFTEESATANKIGRVNLKTPQRQIEFVHGIKTSYKDIQNGIGGFQSLITALPTQNYNLDVFSYYQDLGYRLSDGTCGPQPTPNTNTSPLFTNGGTDPTICDSQDAIAYNATGLDDRLSQFSSPVAVIGYSMGAATARGWLTLAQKRLNDTTLNIVDTLITIQGAQEGSYLPLGAVPVINALSWASPIWTAVITGAEQLTGWDITRPAITDLTPISQWYQSVNPTNVPSNLHYFNFYSDIQVSAHPQLFFISLPSIGPVSFGDDVILPGDPSPNALPALGGARFLPGGSQTTDRYEFRIASNHDVLLGDIILRPLLVNPFSLVGVALDVINDPRSHLNLNQHLSDSTLKINSCLTSVGQLTIQDEILRILSNPSQACN